MERDLITATFDGKRNENESKEYEMREQSICNRLELKLHLKNNCHWSLPPILQPLLPPRSSFLP